MADHISDTPGSGSSRPRQVHEVTVLCPVCGRQCHTMVDMFEHGHAQNLITPLITSEQRRLLQQAGR
jgi:C4-type Zn-finger protein